MKYLVYKLSSLKGGVLLLFILFASIVNAQIKKNNSNTITDSSVIQEQVYIGYGIQKKKEITGAISYVKANQIAERKATDLFDAIQGQVTGIQIARESGRPGASSSVISRGVGTFLDLPSPIYIVDGAMNVNPDGLNPADIESVQVMKDAAASGIYGPNSSNGVIIITTKNGIKGKPRFNCNILTSFGKIAKKIPEASVDDYKLYEKKMNITPTVDTFPFNANNNYQDLITQTAVRNQVDFSISGGSKKLNYYGSFGYLGDKGIIINSWSNIKRVRLNLDYNPTSKLSLGVRLQGSSRKENRLDESTVMPLLLSRSPMLALYNVDGFFTSPIVGASNPLAMASLEKHNYTINDESLYGFASYKFTSYLNLTLNGNLTNNHLDNFNFIPLNILNYAYEDLSNTVLNESKYSALQGYLNFDKTISNKHKIYAMIGFNKGKITQSNQNIAYQYGFTNITSTYDYSNKSEFVQICYSFSEKYFINSSISRENYSNPKWYYYETVSAGWRFSNEKFMDWSKSVLDNGKLRVSYGTTNQSKTESNRSNNYILVYSPSLEQRSQFNVGIDFSLFKGKLNLNIDVYTKQTKNALIQIPIPFSSGFSTDRGTINNRGIELQLDAHPIKTKSFSWNVSLNMSLNKNKVTDFNYTHLFFSGNNELWQIPNGGSIGDLYVYKALGVYQYDASNAYSSDWQLLTTTVLNNSTTYSLNGAPYTGTVKQMRWSKGGDIIFQNINSITGERDSSLYYADKVNIGNAIPKYTGSITNTFNYKQFSLSFNLCFSLCNKLYNGELYNANFFGRSALTPAFINGAWTKQGDVTIYPNLTIRSSSSGSSLYVEDASFVRLRNIRLTYHLPHPHLTTSKNDEVSFYLFANNIATWTKYSGFDPEIAVTNGTTAGYDGGRYPRKKEIGVGVNIGF